MSIEKSIRKVSNVIQVMQSGLEFYQDAIEKLENGQLKDVFTNVVRNKIASIESLQSIEISEKGEREEGSSLMVDARKMYTHFSAMFTANKEHAYINQLEEVEDKVLEVLDEALAQDQSDDALAILRRVRVNAQRIHNEIKTLQAVSDH